VQIGEVAAAPAGDQNFFSDPLCAFEDQYVPLASPGLDGTHQPSGPGSQNNRVVSLIHASISLSGMETDPYNGHNSRCVG
jgi:hypothetical protein